MSVHETVALYSMLHKAVDERKAVCVLYRTGGTTEKARVFVPRTLHTAKNGADCLYGWDSIRQSEITLRVDRIDSAHVIG